MSGWNKEFEAELAFESAKKCGLKVEDYMFMCSENGLDYFKHIITRKYVTLFRI